MMLYVFPVFQNGLSGNQVSGHSIASLWKKLIHSNLASKTCKTVLTCPKDAHVECRVHCAVIDWLLFSVRW